MLCGKIGIIFNFFLRSKGMDNNMIYYNTVQNQDGQNIKKTKLLS